MKREYIKGIYTGNTVRYVGNNQYSTRRIFELKTRGLELLMGADSVRHCQHCGGSKFSCKGGFYEMNQYSKKIWKSGEKKHIQFQFQFQFQNN